MKANLPFVRHVCYLQKCFQGNEFVDIKASQIVYYNSRCAFIEGNCHFKNQCQGLIISLDETSTICGVFGEEMKKGDIFEDGMNVSISHSPAA